MTNESRATDNTGLAKVAAQAPQTHLWLMWLIKV